LFAGIATGLLLVIGAGVAHAQGFYSGGSITVPQGKTVDQTIFAAGHTIDIAGKVNGDVFCAGQDVIISGTVSGDVICAGQNVHITGTIIGSVRVAGQDVSLGNSIGRNLTAAGQTVTLESNSSVGGDASIGGQTASINGTVGRDLAIGSNDATIDNSVGRNVQFTGEHLSLGSQANISGTLTYTSNNQVAQASGAHVGGAISQQLPAAAHHGHGINLFWLAVYGFASLLIVALVLVLVAPQLFHSATEVAIHSPGKTILVGFLSGLVVPALVFFLFVTVIGIPLALLLLLIWILVDALATVFAAYYLGRLLMPHSHHAIRIMLLGAAALLVLYLIPILDVLVVLLAMWFGLGIILLNVYRHWPRPRYELKGGDDK
jgi:hypothetical protein